MDTGGARPLNHSSPSRVTGPTQRTDFFHGLLTARVVTGVAGCRGQGAGGGPGRRASPLCHPPRDSSSWPGCGGARSAPLRWSRRRRRGRRRRHPPSPSGAARRTRRARTRDVRFVKGGVARAGCRRRGRAGRNRSGAADLAAVLVTYHRRGVAGRWRRVGEKIALEDDAGRRAARGARRAPTTERRTASMVSWLRGRGAGSRRSTTWWWWATDGDGPHRAGSLRPADAREPSCRPRRRSSGSALPQRLACRRAPRRRLAAGVLPGPPRRRAEPGRGCARDSGAWFPAKECRVGTASRRPCSPPCP